MMRAVRAVVALAVFGGCASIPMRTARAEGPRFDVQRAKLDNGLRVVMLVDHAAPTVAVDVVYDVGWRNEPRGRSGFARLLEHMMSQGSRNVARGEHGRLVAAHGGAAGETTTEDRTSYSETLSSSELALALWLEADRMRSLDVSQKSLESQRAIVKEEHRMRIENAAYVPAAIRLQELVYQGYWPYEHGGVGTTRDLDGAQIEWVRAFHAAYYAPNEAVLAIVGDFEPADATTLVKKYFAEARPQEKVPKLELPQVPEQTQPRAAVVEDAHAKLAAILCGWAIPPANEPDHDAIFLAAMILGEGESSRLGRSLVHERSVAVEAEAHTKDRRGPDMFEIVVKLSSAARVADVTKQIEGIVTDLARSGPSDDEMRKAKNRLRARIFLSLQSNLSRAERLAEMELDRGDARLLNGELDRYLAVTKDDVKRVVARYLTPARRSVVELKPGAGEKK